MCAPMARCCAARISPRQCSTSNTGPMPPSATHVLSEHGAHPVRNQHARFGARSAKTMSSACAPTSRLQPTRRPCASARSGSSRYLRKASSGTRCGGSVYGACGGSTRSLLASGRTKSEATAAKTRVGSQTVSRWNGDRRRPWCYWLLSLLPSSLVGVTMNGRHWTFQFQHG